VQWKQLIWGHILQTGTLLHILFCLAQHPVFFIFRTDEEVQEAITIIGKRTPNTLGEEYLDVEAADNVLNRFGMPTHMPRYALQIFNFDLLDLT